MKHSALIIVTTIFITISILLGAPLWVTAEQAVMQLEPATQQQLKMDSQNKNLFLSTRAKEIIGKSVVNSTGEELGEVKKIVQDRSNNRFNAVVFVGGFWGIGARRIILPISELLLRNDHLEWNNSMTKDTLKQQPKYVRANYKEVNENQMLAEITTDVVPRIERELSFQKLDIDRSGFLTPNEAQRDRSLSTNWKQADKNEDEQIDQAEFSAFEDIRPELMRIIPKEQIPSPSEQ